MTRLALPLLLALALVGCPEQKTRVASKTPKTSEKKSETPAEPEDDDDDPPPPLTPTETPVKTLVPKRPKKTSPGLSMDQLTEGVTVRDVDSSIGRPTVKTTRNQKPEPDRSPSKTRARRPSKRASKPLRQARAIVARVRGSRRSAFAPEVKELSRATRLLTEGYKAKTVPFQDLRNGIVEIAEVFFERIEAAGLKSSDVTKQAAQVIGPVDELKLSQAQKKSITDGIRELALNKAKSNLREAKRYGNESGAIATLATLRNCKSIYRAGDKDGDGKKNYAPSIEALREVRLVDPKLGTGLKFGYLFEIRASPDRRTWMATAQPSSPSAGKRHFVTNKSGKVYSSLRRIELNDACTIPRGLTPVR